MQDQGHGPSVTESNAPAAHALPASPAPAAEDPIDRLNRALQRISFALAQSRQAKDRKRVDRQELVANVDVLISRVRDALAHADRPEDK